MCMQCVVGAEVLARDVIPGYQLMVSAGGSETWPAGDEDWPKGYLGLVQCNDPLFVVPPIPDPNNVIEFGKFLGEFDKTGFTLKQGWDLVEACRQVGYDPVEDGRTEWWLFSRIYKILNPEWKEEDDETELARG